MNHHTRRLTLTEVLDHLSWSLVCRTLERYTPVNSPWCEGYTRGGRASIVLLVRAILASSATPTQLKHFAEMTRKNIVYYRQTHPTP